MLLISAVCTGDESRGALIDSGVNQEHRALLPSPTKVATAALQWNPYLEILFEAL